MDKFENLAKVEAGGAVRTTPGWVLCAHGDRDEIVPYHHLKHAPVPMR